MTEDTFPKATTFEELHDYLRMNGQLISCLPKYTTLPVLKLKGTWLYNSKNGLTQNKFQEWIKANLDPETVRYVFKSSYHTMVLPVAYDFDFTGTLVGFAFTNDDDAAFFRLMFGEDLTAW